MSLYEYFQLSNSILLKCDVPLLTGMPSSIPAAYKKVQQVLEQSNTSRLEEKDATPTSKRGMYKHFTAKEEVQVRKGAVRYGVTESVW